MHDMQIEHAPTPFCHPFIITLVMLCSAISYGIGHYYSNKNKKNQKDDFGGIRPCMTCAFTRINKCVQRCTRIENLVILKHYCISVLYIFRWLANMLRFLAVFQYVSLDFIIFSAKCVKAHPHTYN